MSYTATLIDPEEDIGENIDTDDSCYSFYSNEKKTKSRYEANLLDSQDKKSINNNNNNNNNKEFYGLQNNWNNRFRDILDLPTSDRNQLLEKYKNLSSLAKDFETTAKRYGEIIITEVYLDSHLKTIKPTTGVGGQAGGEKFILHDILFKFSTNWKGFYESDAEAAKAAGHELKSLVAFQDHDVRLVKFPLMCLIDYRGFRLVAVSMLPLHSKSLIYGSQDAGKTVLNSDEKFFETMKILGKKMNLKAHVTGITSKKVNLIGPTDLEGHKGNDGKYYLLDFARLMPPEAPGFDAPSMKGSFLFRLLRPELVARNSEPLSSDAYSQFGSHNSEIHNEEVKKATRKIFNEIIPDVANILDEMVNDTRGLSNSDSLRYSVGSSEPSNLVTSTDFTEPSNLVTSTNFTEPSNLVTSTEFNPGNENNNNNNEIPSAPPINSIQQNFDSEKTQKKKKKISPQQFINIIHSNGINIRHLGLVRKASTEQSVKDTILLEMCSRACRYILREKERKTMKNLRTMADQPFKALLVDFFNLVLGNSGEASKIFWKIQIKEQLTKQFYQALSPEEKSLDFHLFSCINSIELFERLQELTGVSFRTSTKTQLLKNVNHFKLIYADLLEVRPIVKSMNLIDRVEGTALSLESENEKGDQKERLWQLSVEKFKDALKSVPNQKKTLLEYGNAQSLRLFSIADQFSIIELTEQIFKNYFAAGETSCLEECFKNLLNINLSIPFLNEKLISIVLMNFQKFFKNQNANEDSKNQIRYAEWNIRGARCLLNWLPEDITPVKKLLSLGGEMIKRHWKSKFLPTLFSLIPLSDVDEFSNLEIGYLALMNLDYLSSTPPIKTLVFSELSELSNEFFKKITKMPSFHKIKALSLRKIRLDSKILTNFLNQTKNQLSYLEIQNCNFTFPIKLFELAPELETFKASYLDSSFIDTPISSKIKNLCLIGISPLFIPNLNDILANLKSLILTNNPGLNDKTLENVNFKKLKILEKLDLGGNLQGTVKSSKFTDLIASQFSEIKNLTFLNLMWIKELTDNSLTSCLSNLKKLIHLNISFTKITDKVFQNFSFPKTLKSINLSGTKIGDETIELLSKFCKSITEVRIAQTLISDIAIQNMSENWKTLTVLDISHCSYILNRILLSGFLFNNFSTLKILDLSYLPCAGSLIFGVKTILKKLKVDKTNLTNETLLSIIENCPELHLLSVEANAITNTSIEHISKLKYLKTLMLSSSKNVSDISCLKSDLLEQISFSDCPITDKSLTKVTSNCPNLKFLKTAGSLIRAPKFYGNQIREFQSGKNAKDGCIENLVQSSPFLIKLTLNFAANLTSKSLRILSQTPFSLHSLLLGYNTFLDDNSLSILIKHHKALLMLDISGVKFSNYSKTSTAITESSLRRLHINETNFSKEELKNIFEKTKYLLTVEAIGCQNCTTQLLNDLNGKIYIQA